MMKLTSQALVSQALFHGPIFHADNFVSVFRKLQALPTSNKPWFLEKGSIGSSQLVQPCLAGTATATLLSTAQLEDACAGPFAVDEDTNFFQKR